MLTAVEDVTEIAEVVPDIENLKRILQQIDSCQREMDVGVGLPLCSVDVRAACVANGSTDRTACRGNTPLSQLTNRRCR